MPGLVESVGPLVQLLRLSWRRISMRTRLLMRSHSRPICPVALTNGPGYVHHRVGKETWLTYFVQAGGQEIYTEMGTASQAGIIATGLGTSGMECSETLLEGRAGLFACMAASDGEELFKKGLSGDIGKGIMDVRFKVIHPPPRWRDNANKFLARSWMQLCTDAACGSIASCTEAQANWSDPRSPCGLYNGSEELSRMR